MQKNYIIIHHSATVAGKTSQWAGICKFHTSWRRMDKGEIITEKQAGELTARGIHCEPPWAPPCGYHRGIERVDGKIVVQQGRPLDENGAHAVGFNAVGVGLCVVGNYDAAAPDAELWEAIKTEIKTIAKEIGMDLAWACLNRRVIGHRETYVLRNVPVEKTCPGTAFDLDKLRRELCNDEPTDERLNYE